MLLNAALLLFICGTVYSRFSNSSVDVPSSPLCLGNSKQYIYRYKLAGCDLSEASVKIVLHVLVYCVAH